MSLKVGLVKWFNEEKGFGIIASPDGEYFFHVSNLLFPKENVEFVMPIVFTPFEDRGRNSARACHVPKSVEDFYCIVKLLDAEYIVNIETTFTIILRSL